MRKINKKVAAALAAGVVVVAGSGVAYAYWTSTGGGTGTASTSNGDNGTAHFLSVTQNTTLNAMYPGDTPQAFTANVKNVSTDNSSVYVSGVTAYLTIDSAHATAGCTVSDYKLDGSTTADSGHPVSLHWTAVELTSGSSQDTSAGDTIGFNDKAGSNQNACKGATVTINYAAS